MNVPALMAGYISPLGGSDAWKTFDEKIGGAMNCVFELGSALASDKIPASVEFYNGYKKAFGHEIQAGHGPAPSYEAVYILAEAIERAGSLDPDAITAELKKTDRMGAMGRVRFDEGNQAVYGFDPKETAVAAVFQWTGDGKRRIVFPESLAEGKMELPKGLKPVK
jgi:branched-chain amino acid transport system substrate-binding protein